MIVVTAGDKFTDIDAFGGCIAYAELLRGQGNAAVAVLAGVLNESIPSVVRELPVNYETKYVKRGEDEFVLVDISDMTAVASFVSHDKVVEVIDHHAGYDTYWSGKGIRVQIEPVGAACTQVYERWVEANKFAEMSVLTARLLACGILDNTLNFHASITTDRDRVAYTALSKKGELDDAWQRQYFSDCEQGILADPLRALKNDTKHMTFAGFPQMLVVGQLMLWDASLLLPARQALEDQMETYNEPWCINLISISEGKNYILARDQDVQQFISRVLEVSFEDGIAHTDRLWLRKEIMHRAIETNATTD